MIVICIYVYTYMYTYMYVCIYIHTYIHTCLCICICICICVYVYLYLYISLSLYIYIYIYMRKSRCRLSGYFGPAGTQSFSEGVMIRLENPRRARISQFELFELILSLKLDRQFRVEQFEATVSQSTVPSPLLLVLASSTRTMQFRSVCFPGGLGPRWARYPLKQTYTYTYTLLCLYTHMCVYISIYLSLSLSLYIYIYITIYIYIYIYQASIGRDRHQEVTMFSAPTGETQWEILYPEPKQSQLVSLSLYIYIHMYMCT